MGIKKLQLIKTRSSYQLLIYENNSEIPTFRRCFGYADRLEEQALNEARKEGKEIAEQEGISLEEKITNS